MGRKVKLVSHAHEWAYEHGLVEGDGSFDTSLYQSDGTYIPEFAMDDPFAEAAEFFVEATEEQVGVSLGFCDGRRFPDGSALWWSEDHWGVTDPDLLDATKEWQLNEVATSH